MLIRHFLSDWKPINEAINEVEDTCNVYNCLVFRIIITLNITKKNG